MNLVYEDIFWILEHTSKSHLSKIDIKLLSINQTRPEHDEMFELFNKHQ